MIDFKPIRIEDKALIEHYTLPSGLTNCDLAFANMYCWQFLYHSAWAEVEDFLVIRFHIGGGEQIGYMQPVGEGDFSRILPTLRDDAHAAGQPLRLVGLTDAACERLRHEAFAFHSNRALEDYLYTADDLRNLTGRHLQSKRNHINRFKAEYPTFRYAELTHERTAECMTLEREWRKVHEGHTSELCAEQRAMQRAFEQFKALELRGGCIYVGDRLVAFTYGSAVNAHTFDTHVEKADAEFDGAFTIINKLFAQHLPPSFTLINREEDLGIDGLRRAKLSYHPTALPHKFTALDLDTEQIACKALWQRCFGDDESFVDHFLIDHYRSRNMLTVWHNDSLVAMLHIVPMESELGRTAYIYGVATAPECRHQGLADGLMRQAMQLIEQRGDEAAMLIPSSTWIREFYARFGFEGAVPVTFTTNDDFDFGTGVADSDVAMIWRRNASKPLPTTLHSTPIAQ
ncbi:MAG: GNAT family N-acetyltransferase [Alistipes sp.]